MGWRRPRLLAKTDGVEAFHSTSEPLDTWLIKYAWGNQQSGMSRVFVSTLAASDERVIGYYALATGGVAHSGAPPRVAKGIPKHPIPVIIVTRLAVDREFQGQGLGRALVRDAFARVLVAADVVGVRALLIHAKDVRARDYYLRIAECEPSPTDPLHLFILLKDLRKVVST